MGRLSITFIFLTLLLVGCVNIDLNEKVGSKEGVREVLDVLYMHEKLGTKRIDLSQNGKCPGTKVLNTVNIETRGDKHVFFNRAGDYYIIPKTLAGSVAIYMNKKFIPEFCT